MTFPRQHARTARFRLGTPRDFTVSPDGRRVVFLRSLGAEDQVNRLWTLDVASGEERLVVDPGDGRQAELSEAERAHRERTREYSHGLTGYATDADVTKAVYALNGRLFLVELDSGAVKDLGCEGSDPRLDPTGARVAYVADGALRVVGGLSVDPDGPEVTWGLPEHVAAESMDRHRGHWWSPDGTVLLAARVDNAPVERWHVADPANPASPPRVMAYPRACTPNADVSLWLVTMDGERTEVRWDRAAFEYVARVAWTAHDLLVQVQSRDQRTTRILSVAPTGETTTLHEDNDAAWVELVAGVPARTASGALVRTADVGDTRHLVVGDAPVTPEGLQVVRVLSVDGDTMLFQATEEPTERHLYTYDGTLTRVTTEAGVHTGVRAGGTTVVVSRTLDRHGVRVRAGAHEIASKAATPALRPRVTLLRLGERELRSALLFPTGHVEGSARLPVLLDPYGGPHGSRATAVLDDHLVSQWFADQGYAVLVTDGRGTPGRGPAWERTIKGDKLSHALEDQIEALRAAAAAHPDLDLGRVGIRGWSYGGYLAAAAVLRHPEVFHAAVAGAPVTDARLYDTHWQERYLDQDPAAYDRSSLIADAPKLSRPLLLVHGLADDNVFAAHTLRLSGALLEAGRPHTVLPLSGVSHMTPQETVAENLLLLQLDFLDRNLKG
ncbi:prolyl oligopeptidase family serine peptidase [Nonomuraea sp. NPDC049152]|uniref:prolyl oligopeptidase family serine peptidase n=1 Tax=Nonomuraea sp. NPDC049152 TaxID=3154350 RepID=UPI0033DC09B3